VDKEAPSAHRVWQLNRWARALAYFTIGYNVLEAVVAISAGSISGSPALISFGGDSVVESLSALVIIWQFHSDVPEERERLALRFIAVAFFVLTAYVAVDALRALLVGVHPEPSAVGIVLAIISLIVMPTLFAAKRRVGRALGSTSVTADSVQTLLCVYLSVVLLAGLLLNAWLGWWWADPIAALVIAAIALREGIEAWQGDDCC
jgi:divalent metal cation (Fe/Co/Zn/Cd) transporter